MGRSSSRFVVSTSLLFSFKLTSSSLQLFTKAYEFFKANRAKNMTFYIAAQIASAHLENGKDDMAFRFV
jgi:hypothetical protein